MKINKHTLLSIFMIAVLTGCSAPKKSVYHKPGSKSRSYKKPQKPDNTGKEEYLWSDEEVTARKADDYLPADGLTSNKKLNALVNDWLGVPHRLGGKDKDGVDCSGFTTIVMRNIYKRDLVGSSAEMATKCKEIKKDQLNEGDLVFFKIGGSRVSHVGVYLAKGYFAHATLRKGVMISSMTEPYYEKYYSSSGRYL